MRARHWLDALLPLAAAEVAVAGVALAVVPQHAGSIGRLLAASLAGGAALLALAATARRSADAAAIARRSRPSPLDRPPPAPPTPMQPPGLTAARRALAGRASSGDLPLTTAVWERLVVVAYAAFGRRGIDIDNPLTREHAQISVSPEVWRTLTTRPRPPTSGAPPAPERVAASVARILDEVGGGTAGRPEP